MIPHSIDEFRTEVLQNGYDQDTYAFFDALMNNYPNFKFRVGAKFAFRPPRTIVIGPMESTWKLLTLHEVSHAICRHRSFNIDIERLKMETEAWEKARELANEYKVEINEEMIQSELDTYRDWLHKKSRCPHCGLTRFQTPDSRYHCPMCDSFRADKK